MTTIATQESAIITNATSLEDESMSEIDALAAKVVQLSSAADFWNKAMLWGLAAAALAAVFIVITTRLAILRTSQAGEAQAELEKAKDRVLADDLKTKDLQIEEMRAKAAGLDKEAAALRAQLVKQDSRGHLLEDATKRATVISALKPFAGTKVAIRWCPKGFSDNEMTFLSLHLMGVFTEAKWAVVDVSPTLLGCAPGMFLSIDPNAPPLTKKAADAAAKALTQIGLLGAPVVTLTPGKLSTADTKYLETPGVDGIIVGVQAHP
jgi:hypothetical protein